MAVNIVFSIAWSVLLLIPGASFLFEIYYGNASKNWPKTKGQVTVSELLRSETWRHKFAYEYSIEGQNYTAKRKRFAPNINSSGPDSPAQKDEAKYPIETSVDAYYGPKNPSRATLETGKSLGLVIAVRIMAVIYLIGLVAGFFIF